jgi:DNA-binding transcriptional regulator YhcF (GntR family)
MTGLRVETVIRAIKSLEGEGVLSIERGKIIWSPEENPPPNTDT